ncbi:5217_t:CDS:2 [Cetraspora pellucida]|uniref:5217_t:CDS:1 n=1 Tax=Cetraspora pellucida TaxID=1433469 RepID=A0A9N9ENN8_9GLOM|nr:5217_t:CDS:2 [Cetraspora pellucida]
MSKSLPHPSSRKTPSGGKKKAKNALKKSEHVIGILAIKLEITVRAARSNTGIAGIVTI